MKLFTLLVLFLAGSFITTAASAQNVSINVLTQHSGLVGINGTIFVEVTIANTSSTTAVPNYKLRPQISIPASIANIPASGHDLPFGWSITFNSGSVIRLSNGTDQVPAGEARTLLIALQGTALGGPQTVGGNLLFSNGVAPGSASGPATVGDNTADNVSSSTVQVYDPVPVTLTDFKAVLVNCQPLLKWITQTEINSERFEIERSREDDPVWVSIAVVAAAGNTNAKSEYEYTDKGLGIAAVRVFYRLKMIDKDGHYKYSEILPVLVNCKNINVNVYPNPVQHGRLYVSLSGGNGYTEVRLLSVSGQLILKSTINNGTNYINTSNIADGVYIMSITDSNGLDKKIKVLINN